MNFPEWFVSEDNPLRNASEIVRFATKEALHAAFLAGEKHGKREKKQAARDEANANIFS